MKHEKSLRVSLNSILKELEIDELSSSQKFVNFDELIMAYNIAINKAVARGDYEIKNEI